MVILQPRHVRDSSYLSFIHGKSLISSRHSQFLPLLHPWQIPYFVTSFTVPTTPSSMANPSFCHVRDSSYHSFIHGESLNSSRQEQFLQLLNLCRVPHLSGLENKRLFTRIGSKGNDSSTFIQIKRLVSRWSAKRRVVQRDRVKGEGVVNKIKRIQEREGKDDNVPFSPNLSFNVRLFYFHVSEHCLHSMIWNGGARGVPNATFASVAQLSNALVVLSSTAEDGEIEVQISVGEKSDIDSTMGRKTPRLEPPSLGGSGGAIPAEAIYSTSPSRRPHTITGSPEAMKVRLAAMVLQPPTRHRHLSFGNSRGVKDNVYADLQVPTISNNGATMTMMMNNSNRPYQHQHTESSYMRSPQRTNDYLISGHFQPNSFERAEI
uniref:Uncharacterized protein n=1 Tax=Timema shepardi TaxID=629360 RepID=A0A7R9FWN5_TIMSH|nr:unnamed protein product [Timema shepardi]